MSKLSDFFSFSRPLRWILIFQGFRFLLLPLMGLMPQDAYYYLYGQHLSWSYFDHPGMIGYLLRFTSEIFGQSVFVVKLTDFTITSLTMYFFYQLACQFLEINKAKQSLLLLASTIFVSILSFNSTPDVPLLLFWTMSILFLQKAIFQERHWYWIAAGVSMGLAFNSKYTAILLPFGLLAFLILSNTHRKKLISPWFLAALLISLTVSFPVFYWNYSNNFASFTFQSTQRTSSITEFNINPKYFFGAIGHQLFLLLPILFVIFVKTTYTHIWAFFRSLSLPKDEDLFLLAFFLPTFLGFFMITPIYWVKLNWMMPSYVTGIILATVFFNKKLIKVQLLTSWFFHILLAAQIIFYLVPIKSDDTWVGWEELSNSITEIQKEYPDSFIFSDDNYKTSAALNFFNENKVYAQNIIGKNALHFDYLGDDLSLLEGKNALFIDSDKRVRDLNKKGSWDETLGIYFSKVTELEPIIIKERGKVVRKFWVYFCENYKKK